MALHTDDIDGFGAEAPRPLDESAVERGSFARLGEGQGAMHVRRRAGGNAKSEAAGRLGKRTVVALAAIVVVVLALGATLFARVLGAAAPADQEAAEATYKFAHEDDGYAVVQTSDDGSSRELGALEGTPVDLFELGDTIVVPQNHADGTWDVQAYTMGVGWSAVVDQAGEPQTGTGTISEARIDGSTLVLAVDGATVSVPLTW